MTEKKPSNDQAKLVVKSERLKPGQNLLDQPPFSFLQANENLLPQDIFIGERNLGFAQFMISLARLKQNNMDRVLQDRIRLLLQEKHRSRVLSIIRAVNSFLEPYDGWYDYLIISWSEYLKNALPSSKIETHLSYAGYCALMKKISDVEDRQAIINTFNVAF